MEKLLSNAEDLVDKIKEYVNTRIDSLKLSVAEKSSGIVANGVARIIVALFVLFFMALGSIALSLIIGIWIGKMWAGFLVVGGFYLLLGFIVWATRDKLIRVPVMNAMIQQMFSNDEEDS